MAESMIERMALARIPHAQQGISDPMLVARDVLTAMREPTYMKLRVGIQIDPSSRIEQQWRAMIDAASAEE